MKHHDIRFTVFTPTFNRGYLLENVYRSLQRQTFRDFEWLVVDDGSADNTMELLEQWSREENFFPIVYCRVPNGGKHRAINHGLSMARGELFFILDSDDELTETALEVADRVEKTIPLNQKDQFCGICGLKGTSKDAPLGTTFSGKEYLDITHIERDNYTMDGDKAEIYYSDILENYPFPEFSGENFLVESVVWERMAWDGYKIRYFNEIIYLCEYLPDGLTKNSGQLLVRNPKGYGLSIRQRTAFGMLKGRDKWEARWRYYRLLKTSLTVKEIAGNLAMSRFGLLGGLFVLKIYSKVRCKK